MTRPRPGVEDRGSSIRHGDELLEGVRWIGHGLSVVDEGEEAVVEGDEFRIRPFSGQHQALERQFVRGEEAGGAGLAGDRRIEPDDDVRLGRFALELHAAQRGDGVFRRHELDDAAALRLEPRFDRGAGPPLRGKAIVSIDAQDGDLLGGGRQGRQCEESRNCEAEKHGRCPFFVLCPVAASRGSGPTAMVCALSRRRVARLRANRYGVGCGHVIEGSVNG
jgi:hypothetical protein